MYLYHIHKKEDKGKLNLGYIGITNDPETRFSSHIKRPKNEMISEAVNSGDFEISLITNGSESEIRRMEKYLRPEMNIGWNIAIGGGIPPKQKKKVKERICKVCYRYFYSLKRINTMYCCKDCKRKSASERSESIKEENICKYCKCEFKAFKHLNQKYCSIECYHSSLNGRSKSEHAREYMSKCSKRSKPVVVNGVGYRSLREAGRATGINYSTLKYRLKKEGSY